MLRKRKKVNEITKSLWNSAIIIVGTIEQMIELFKDSLLFEPGIEGRNNKIQLMRDNIVVFIEQIEQLLVERDEEIKEKGIALIYSSIFNDLRLIAEFIRDTSGIVSSEFKELQIGLIDELVSLQTHTTNAIHVLSRLLHSFHLKKELPVKYQIDELEYAAYEHNKMIITKLHNEAEDWKTALFVKIIAEQMLRIIYLSLDSASKIVMVKKITSK